VGAPADGDESDVYLLVGLPGAGKYTIARALEALLTSRGCTVRVVDNHYMCNPIFRLVAEDGVTPLPAEVRERVREVRAAVTQTIESLSPGDWSFIFTHVVDTPNDLEWIERLASLAERRRARFVVVRVLCEFDELRRRVVIASRRDRMKSVSVDDAIQGFARGVPDLDRWHPLNLDVTRRSPDDAAEMILRHRSG
jgi:tRNA uridine 5-carbamoylmethylation protein Kti12